MQTIKRLADEPAGPEWARPRIALRIRHRTSAKSGSLPTNTVDWPERQYHPGRGWPVWIPATSHSRYLSGYHALNLPALDGEPRLGDWHEDQAWWSPTYLGPNGEPDVATLWGPNGTHQGAPGGPELHDARRALTRIEHPAAKNNAPVHCATIAQAIVDLAWDELGRGGPGPGRREIVSWTDGPEEDRLRALAERIEACIADPDRLGGWHGWQRRSLDGEDPLHSALHTRGSTASTWGPAPALRFVVGHREGHR